MRYGKLDRISQMEQVTGLMLTFLVRASLDFQIVSHYQFVDLWFNNPKKKTNAVLWGFEQQF
jgi:succinate dehydrogenase hydrophobic anchor subunit